ncbi:tryptophan synthase subunit alpha [Martelella limonii]|uniref:tryptophan synthase subunit alpha n=1 Tax=Martelella limonii TaxID=1647649 RepID=UPI00158102EF|nr:tryptophan synthase subunit alpha [Martelella limonii]
MADRTNRIDALFDRLKKQGRKAFATFTVGGDPTHDESLARLKAFVSSGIDLIEIGYPFSDPILDGATIQKANRRAMAAGGNLSGTFELCSTFRKDDDETPLVLMGYANPIIALGVDRFAEKAAEAGIDGIIAADLPLREADALIEALHRHGLYMIPLAAPTLDAADFAVTRPGLGGFLYCIPVVGPTGGPSAPQAAIAEAVERCRRQSKLPVMVGFGVKTPEMAAGVASVADGVIVATALIDVFDTLRQQYPDGGKRMEEHMAETIETFRIAI